MLRQSHRHWEMILVTQGTDSAATGGRVRRSDPALLAAVEQAVARDGRIRSVHIERFGRSRALNAGVLAANSEVIAATDDDCEPDTDWLEVVAGCFEDEPNVGAVAGDLIPSERPFFRVS